MTDMSEVHVWGKESEWWEKSNTIVGAMFTHSAMCHKTWGKNEWLQSQEKNTENLYLPPNFKK